MDHKNIVVSLMFFVAMLSAVDFVKASTVRTDISINKRKPMMSTTISDTSRHRRRSIKEKSHEGQRDICADIIGPEWKMTKRRKGPCQKLVVWVPKKTGFTEFVNIVKVNNQSRVEGGFSIAIFCYALNLLPFNTQPIFKPFVNEKGERNGIYDDIVKHIEGKTCEAVGGDVTVRANRAQYVDFSPPYMSSDVYMLVYAKHSWKQNMLTFFRPFTWRLWMAIVGVCIYIGVAIAFLEYRVGNPKFTACIYQKLKMVIWFPISTFFFHEGRILNRNSKVVLVVWLSMIFIVVQIFTANLSSWLTLDRLRPSTISFEKVGYQDGSYIRELLIQKYNCSSKNLLALQTPEDYKNALSNGSVNVIIHSLPYIELFLSKYGPHYMKFGPIYQASGFAFAFPRDAPLLPNFSKAVINVTENDIMIAMKKKYLGESDIAIEMKKNGFRIPDGSQSSEDLRSLDVMSFIVLFIFVGSLTISAIISSEISIWRAKSKVFPMSMDYK